MANPSPKPSYASPGGTPRRLVGSLQIGNIQSFLNNLKEEEVLRVGRRKSHQKVQQRELVQAIVEDQVQWEKLHHAMKQQRSCTNMGLTQNLRGLIKDRIEDMESTGTYCSKGSNRLRLNSSSSCS